MSTTLAQGLITNGPSLHLFEGAMFHSDHNLSFATEKCGDLLIDVLGTRWLGRARKTIELTGILIGMDDQCFSQDDDPDYTVVITFSPANRKGTYEITYDEPTCKTEFKYPVIAGKFEPNYVDTVELVSRCGWKLMISPNEDAVCTSSPNKMHLFVGVNFDEGTVEEKAHCVLCNRLIVAEWRPKLPIIIDC